MTKPLSEPQMKKAPKTAPSTPTSTSSKKGAAEPTLKELRESNRDQSTGTRGYTRARSNKRRGDGEAVRKTSITLPVGLMESFRATAKANNYSVSIALEEAITIWIASQD